MPEICLANSEFASNCTELCNALWQSAMQMHEHAELLFDCLWNEEFLDVWNRASKPFFIEVQHLAISALLLNIFRMTDSPKNGRKQVVSFARLVFLLRESGKSELANAIEARLARVKAEIDIVHQYRHNYLAHANVKAILGKVNIQMPVASLNSCMDAIRDAAHLAATHAANPQLELEAYPKNTMSRWSTGDVQRYASKLSCMLSFAMAHRQERRAYCTQLEQKQIAAQPAANRDDD